MQAIMQAAMHPAAQVEAKPARDGVSVVVGLGANLGDAKQTVLQTLDSLKALSNDGQLRRSSLWRSAPVNASGPDFINAVAEFNTQFTAPALLAALQAIEAQAGRERLYRNAPRTLDLDLIFYGQARMQSPTLTLPHPRWAERAFVLRPLQELNALPPGGKAALSAVAHQLIERVLSN